MQIRAKLQQMTEAIAKMRCYPEQAYGQLSFLASDAATTDAAPTKSMYAVRSQLERQADALMAQSASLK
jgi:hypothetical protein